MTDIVERLRERATSLRGLGDIAHNDANTDDEAADTITALRAEVERLKDIVEQSRDLLNAAQLTRDEENLVLALTARDTGIKALRAENERLRAALESIADLPPGYADMRQDDLVVILANKARAALTTQDKTDV